MRLVLLLLVSLPSVHSLLRAVPLVPPITLHTECEIRDDDWLSYGVSNYVAGGSRGLMRRCRALTAGEPERRVCESR